MADWITQFDFAFVNGDAVGSCQRFTDLFAGNGTEQPAAFACFGLQRQRQFIKLLPQLNSFLFLLVLAALFCSRLILQRLYVAFSSRTNQPPRQQEVGCIAL
ncbi:hypothetical protein D3C87_1758940 [compost metagenome]